MKKMREKGKIKNNTKQTHTQPIKLTKAIFLPFFASSGQRAEKIVMQPNIIWIFLISIEKIHLVFLLK